MKHKSIINLLELAYTPLSNYEFNFLKNDKVIEKIINNASIYIIAQRQILSFENMTVNDKESFIEFEIHQKNNSNILKCKLPFFQEKFETSRDKQIEIAVNSISLDFVKSYPINNVSGFSLIEREPDNSTKFIVWFSPEKLLHNFWSNSIECKIEGNIRDFTSYIVHYVGKATKQNIFKRLTGHSRLQEILSVEHPFQYGNLPTHEITLLLFQFNDNLQIKSYDENSNIDEMVASMLGDTRPPKEKIFLDAEKALIKAMQPKYNRELFKNYPISKDGLYDENFDSIMYSFIDPIMLKYEIGEIICGIDPVLGGDSIIIKNNETFKLMKHP